MTLTENVIRIIDRLNSHVPEFEPSYREHLSFHEEVLPYVLFDEFSRFLIDEYRQSFGEVPGVELHREIVERGIRVLDEILREFGDEGATLVRTSFVETVKSLWSETELFQGLVRLLPPTLQNEIKF